MEGGPGEEAGHHAAHQAIHVRKGGHSEEAIVGGYGQRLDEAVELEQHVAVAAGDAFGPPRRPRRELVHERRPGIDVDAEVRQRRRPVRGRTIVDQIEPAGGFVAGDDAAAQLGVLVRGQQHRHGAALQKEADLLLLVGVVERHRDGAEHQDGEIARHEVQAVGRQQRDAVPSPHPLGLEGPSQRRYLDPEGPVGDARSTFDNRKPVGVRFNDGCKQLRDRVHLGTNRICIVTWYGGDIRTSVMSLQHHDLWKAPADVG